MSKFSRYHTIGQFRDVYKTIQNRTAYVGIDKDGNAIRDWSIPLPTLVFTGSEKLHGTNAAIGFEVGKVSWTQSRNRILTIEDDNAEFCKWVEGSREELNEIGQHIYRNTNESFDNFLIYGEWCGSNIQPQVALSCMPKPFIVFGIKLRVGDEESWLSDKEVQLLLKNKLKTIFDYSTYEVSVDFSNPDEAINKMVEITNEVERQSPIGMAHGVSGIGEGVVWKCGSYIFKVKGKLHSASHVKELIAIDIEKVRNVQECVDKIVTPNRLKQGVDELIANGVTIDNKAIGIFINWIKEDCIKEERDTIVGSDLVIPDVVKAISFKAKSYFIEEVLRKL